MNLPSYTGELEKDYLQEETHIKTMSFEKLITWAESCLIILGNVEKFNVLKEKKRVLIVLFESLINNLELRSKNKPEESKMSEYENIFLDKDKRKVIIDSNKELSSWEKKIKGETLELLYEHLENSFSKENDENELSIVLQKKTGDVNFDYFIEVSSTKSKIKPQTFKMGIHWALYIQRIIDVPTDFSRIGGNQFFDDIIDVMNDDGTNPDKPNFIHYIEKSGNQISKFIIGKINNQHIDL